MKVNGRFFFINIKITRDLGYSKCKRVKSSSFGSLENWLT